MVNSRQAQQLPLTEKLQVADQLGALNADIIEAGFPAASPWRPRGGEEISRSGAHWLRLIAGPCARNNSDIDRAWEAVSEAERPVIDVFLATSEIHLQHKLGFELRGGFAAASGNGGLRA